MTRRERLMRSFRGESVDRPPVSFYELNWYSQKPDDPDPFNIFNDPSWKTLLELTREKTDLIVLRGISFIENTPKSSGEFNEVDRKVETWLDEAGSRWTKQSVAVGGRELTEVRRRDPDINTVWTTEHLLKDLDDFKAWLELPLSSDVGEPDIEEFLRLEDEIGEDGVAAIDMHDPLCAVAPLFDMGTYTIVALTEPELFHRALEKVAAPLYAKTEKIAKALPGRHWRIVGPEYASPPYLPPRLFEEYVVRYITPMMDMVKRYGGYPRLHSHGRLKEILDHIVATGCVGLDPIEPPNQGDVELRYVRQKYGRQLTLFGNLEITDIENLPTSEFEKKVETALREGTMGEGRGFVLMPSASPYGRKLPELTLRNYEKIIECVEKI